MKASLVKKSILVTTIGVIILCAAGYQSPNAEVLNIMNDKNIKSINELPRQTNVAFKPGEILTYRLHYGFMNAGNAVLEVKPDVQKFGTRQTYHIVGNGKTLGSFDWFFKVRDRYETFVDTSALVPWFFVRRVDEGGYTINQDYAFNHYQKKVDVGGGETYPIEENTQDMLSSFYSLRNLDFSKAKEGDLFQVKSFVDKEFWVLKIKFVGRETIKTDFGKFKCMKFRPVLQKGRIFKKEEDLNVWISDDKNKIPVRAEAKILVGSVKLDLLDYKNLANPIALEPKK